MWMNHNDVIRYRIYVRPEPQPICSATIARVPTRVSLGWWSSRDSIGPCWCQSACPDLISAQTSRPNARVEANART